MAGGPVHLRKLVSPTLQSNYPYKQSRCGQKPTTTAHPKARYTEPRNRHRSTTPARPFRHICLASRASLRSLPIGDSFLRWCSARTEGLSPSFPSSPHSSAIPRSFISASHARSRSRNTRSACSRRSCAVAAFSALRTRSPAHCMTRALSSARALMPRPRLVGPGMDEVSVELDGSVAMASPGACAPAVGLCLCAALVPAGGGCRPWAGRRVEVGSAGGSGACVRLVGLARVRLRRALVDGVGRPEACVWKHAYPLEGPLQLHWLRSGRMSLTTGRARTRNCSLCESRRGVVRSCPASQRAGRWGGVVFVACFIPSRSFLAVFFFTSCGKGRVACGVEVRESCGSVRNLKCLRNAITISSVSVIACCE